MNEEKKEKLYRVVVCFVDGDKRQFDDISKVYISDHYVKIQNDEGMCCVSLRNMKSIDQTPMPKG